MDILTKKYVGDLVFNATGKKFNTITPVSVPAQNFGSQMAAGSNKLFYGIVKFDFAAPSMDVDLMVLYLNGLPVQVLSHKNSEYKYPEMSHPVLFDCIILWKGDMSAYSFYNISNPPANNQWYIADAPKIDDVQWTYPIGWGYPDWAIYDGYTSFYNGSSNTVTIERIGPHPQVLPMISGGNYDMYLPNNHGNTYKLVNAGNGLGKVKLSSQYFMGEPWARYRDWSEGEILSIPEKCVWNIVYNYK